MVVLAVLALGWLTTRPATTEAARNERFGWRLLAPALVLMAGLGGAPLVLTFAQATLDLDLRQPWRGAPFVGARLLQDALTEPRFLQAALHTLAFTVISVGLELLLGLALALALNRAFRGRGLVRGAALVPWAIPAVVGAILWRFLFDTLAPDVAWNGDATLAWVPVIVADVWKTTPFVALLLLAGLSQIDPALFEAADMDGASARDRLWHIVLPLLRPAMLVALLFRTLDALRVFDLIFVMTGGGPGTATEVLSVVAHDTMMRDLRIGAGAAMSAIIFGASLVLALIYVRVVGEREAAP
ncbi:MAG: hypothetical protein A2138_00290 [Deltaproteobacteria bacterium RBG_16_71_12]|nr:MAG: hypothetical protein A2138_00290 [Deltaproteobacteria bacterium RBG_16_71_12]